MDVDRFHMQQDKIKFGGGAGDSSDSVDSVRFCCRCFLPRNTHTHKTAVGGVLVLQGQVLFCKYEIRDACVNDVVPYRPINLSGSSAPSHLPGSARVPPQYLYTSHDNHQCIRIAAYKF